jgi:hypothetical protein
VTPDGRYGDPVKCSSFRTAPKFGYSRLESAATSAKANESKLIWVQVDACEAVRQATPHFSASSRDSF